MADGNPAKEALSRYGRSLGLEQRMGSWYRVEDNLVASVDLQKSQYGPQYYVIIGLFLKPLMTERLPKPQNAHVTRGWNRSRWMRESRSRGFWISISRCPMSGESKKSARFSTRTSRH